MKPINNDQRVKYYAAEALVESLRKMFTDKREAARAFVGRGGAIYVEGRIRLPGGTLAAFRADITAAELDARDAA